MSLITRCPACGTMFKVVTDQLKVSQGWVRCGHCSEVFDASLHLHSVPLPSEALSGPPVYASYNEPSQQEAQTSASTRAPGVFFVDSQGLPSSESQTSVLDSDHVTDFDPAAWRQQQAASLLDEARALHQNDDGKAVRAYALDTQELTAAPAITPKDSEDIENEFPLDTANTTDNVSFVRDARREAMWRKPRVRIVLGLVAILLAVAMLLQVLVQQRDSVAAMEPRLKPALQILCSMLQCEVAPLRRIEFVVIESTSLNKTASDSYRLSFSLKNLGTTQVAIPSLEVTLTDSTDQPLVRRVLSPAQLGFTALALGAGSEVAGAVAMQVIESNSTNTINTSSTPSGLTPNGSTSIGPLRVVGYRVLAFYP